MPQLVFPALTPLNWLLTVTNRAIYRLSSGRIGGSFAGTPVYLLITTGRKSGRERAQPLLFIEDGENLAVAASNFGHGHHPAWYLNLKADPNVVIEKRGERAPMAAEEAQGEERARLWERFAEVYAGYRVYETRTDRKIPVIVLKPRGARRSHRAPILALIA